MHCADFVVEVSLQSSEEIYVSRKWEASLAVSSWKAEVDLDVDATFLLLAHLSVTSWKCVILTYRHVNELSRAKKITA